MPPLLLFAAAVAVLNPTAAVAMTTAQEIDWGRSIAREVVAQEGTLSDPLLNRWAKTIGADLTAYAVRSDVPYTVTVINSEEVNAFSIPGGFVFVDAGLLNFVHSDDELAAVLAHEIGHVERRHIVTLAEKAKALEILLDVAGLFAPGVNRFGNLAADLVLYKTSRIDELQADQYGLLLVSRAGYDPDAMATFLERLESIHPEHKSLLGRYFQTHPAVPDRIAHLRGYPELDRPPADAILAQAIHDQNDCEYSIARQKLARVLSVQPSNALARERDAELKAIFSPPPRRPVLRPPPSMRAMANEISSQAQAAAAGVKSQVTLGERDLAEYEKYLDSVGFYVDARSRLGIDRGSRLDRILSSQVRISQSMDHSYDEISQTIAQADDLADADVRLSRDLRQRLDKPDAVAPIGVARFKTLLGRAALAAKKIREAALAARGAMAVGRDRGKIVSTFLDAFDAVSDYKSGDMDAADYYKLQAPLQRALLAAKQAAVAADTAAGLLNDAESLAIMDRLDMTAPDADAPRLDSFARLLAKRFGVTQKAVRDALGGDSTPADIAAASVIAAETNASLNGALARLGHGAAAPLEAAQRLAVRPETMQLELGLVWLSYGDGKL
ncbi:MAG: M48 family metalloprotease [Candidatus Eremiobacteraeota bacterium]|nr:M48 family metalloprotease [Candidatus Eremiobacteraeota bacterium]